MGDAVAVKQTLRTRALERRQYLQPNELTRAAVDLRDVLLEAPEVNHATVIALYVAIGTEPGTRPLIETLYARGTRILLPVVKPDLDLDWAAYDGPDDLVSARMGLLEPAGPRLGPDAVGGAETVLLPGLAVDRDGTRLGRGAGCYDRVLTRVAPHAFTCVLLHDQEPHEEPLPLEQHDRRVRAAATPTGLRRFR